MFIRIKNSLADSAPKSYLSTSVQAGAVSLPVKNINDFTNNYFVQIGQTGEEQTEIVHVNGTPSNGTVAVAQTTFDHPVDTPVFAIKYNQVVFKRSTSGTAGTAAAFGTTNITPDNNFTQFEDSPGASAYAYKTAFYNSQLDVSSSDSAWILGSGNDPNSRAGLRADVRRKVKNVPGVEDEDINSSFNDYMEMMRAAAMEVNEDYGLGDFSFEVGGGTQEYTMTDENYKTPVRLWVVNGSGTTVYRPIRVAKIDPNIDYSLDPRFYQKGDDVIGLLPPPETAGTVQIIGNELDDYLTSDDQLLPRPMRGYRSGFIDHALSVIYYEDGKDALGKMKEDLALAKVEKFKRSITPRQKFENEDVEIVEGVNFGSDYSNGGF